LAFGFGETKTTHLHLHPRPNSQQSQNKLLIVFDFKKVLCILYLSRVSVVRYL
jgi:hypothetical protein